MVHREAGLVQHVADLEAKMQKFIAGGKNVTEEEVVRQEERLRTEGGAAQHMQEVNEKREGEVALLRKEAEVREEESKEVHAKLSMVGCITPLVLVHVLLT